MKRTNLVYPVFPIVNHIPDRLRPFDDSPDHTQLSLPAEDKLHIRLDKTRQESLLSERGISRGDDVAQYCEGLRHELPVEACVGVDRYPGTRGDRDGGIGQAEMDEARCQLGAIGVELLVGDGYGRRQRPAADEIPWVRGDLDTVRRDVLFPHLLLFPLSISLRNHLPFLHRVDDIAVGACRAIAILLRLRQDAQHRH